ncbi:magnesium and cobalt transport protein CorA [Cutibacterium acnes JCM 18918]|nr:magnesium and cobalt transport protein CorA [Cutibacterium acnes JCM 18918]
MSLSQLSSRVWQYGKVIAESVPLETLNEELSDTRTLSWYDLTAPDREDIDILADELNLDFHTVEDAELPVSARRLLAILTISSSRPTPRPLVRPMIPTVV